MHLHCCHGVCKSDSRKPEAGVTFMPFPKPGNNLKTAKRWVHLCARKEFTIKSINRFTYICSKHFHPGEILDIKVNPNLEPFNARKRIRTHHFAKNTRVHPVQIQAQSDTVQITLSTVINVTTKQNADVISTDIKGKFITMERCSSVRIASMKQAPVSMHGFHKCAV